MSNQHSAQKKLLQKIENPAGSLRPGLEILEIQFTG